MGIGLLLLIDINICLVWWCIDNDKSKLLIILSTFYPNFVTLFVT